jgi:hypothetical protein
MYAEGVEYYDPRDLQKQGDGHVLAQLRLEYWRPQREGRVTWRSERQKVEVDCADYRFRFLSIDAFPANNLQGRPKRAPFDGAWTDTVPEDDANGQEIRQICSFASLLGTPDSTSGAPPPPTSLEDTPDWFARYTKPGGDVFLKQYGSVGFYYSPPDLERLSNGHVRGWLRREFMWPTVVGNSGLRSARTRYDIDCAHRRFQALDLIVFPGQNLTGAPDADFSRDDAPLQAIRAGSQEAPIMRALCALAADPKISVTDALRPPTIPYLDGGDEAAVEAWIKAHLLTAGYVVSSYDSKSVFLYEPGSLDLRPRGVLAVTMRSETIGTQPAGRPRSMLFAMEFDCQRHRSRMTGSSFFDETNLEGEREDLGGLDWSRISKGSHEEVLAQKICVQRALLAPDIDREAALTPPPVSTDEDDVIAWMSAHVRPMDYVYVTHTDEVVGLYSWTEGERTRQDSIRIWTRYEYFDPKPGAETVIRSMRRLMEYDCDLGRSRILTSELYPGANLSGRPSTRQFPTAEWSFNSPGTLESRLADAVCELGDAADAEMEDALTAPRLPTPGAATHL